MADEIWLLRDAEGGVVELAPSTDSVALADRVAEADTLLWLDLTDPGPAARELLEAGMAVHPLALEDLEKRRQRSKIDVYPGHYVVVAYEALPPTDDGSFDLGEIHLIATAGALVSAHWGPSPVIEHVIHRFRNRAPGVGRSPGSLLYAVLDEVADGYFPLLDRMSDLIDVLEDRVVAGERQQNVLRDVLMVKRELLELRRVAGPLRDVANTLLRRELEIVSATDVPYYQDLYDHLVRVLDTIDLSRDILAAALDANLAIASNNLNVIVKRLTALTVIIMLPTLIAGIYGMNFRVMPELDWALGYPFALGLMVLAALAAVTFFRSRDWI